VRTDAQRIVCALWSNQFVLGRRVSVAPHKQYRICRSKDLVNMRSFLGGTDVKSPVDSLITLAAENFTESRHVLSTQFFIGHTVVAPYTEGCYFSLIP
jgi:hypothetical protein